MTELDADIICVTETHFGEEYDDAELSIPNYNLFRVDRNVNGGGSIIYTNIRLSVVHLESFVVDDCVAMSFDTHKGITEDQNQLLLTEFNKLPVDDNSELIIVGDFNLGRSQSRSPATAAHSNNAIHSLCTMNQ